MNKVIVVFIFACTVLSFTMAARADDSAPYPEAAIEQIAQMGDESVPAPPQEPFIAPESYPDPEPVPMQEPAENPETVPTQETTPAQESAPVQEPASDSEQPPPPAPE